MDKKRCNTREAVRCSVAVSTTVTDKDSPFIRHLFIAHGDNDRIQHRRTALHRRLVFLTTDEADTQIRIVRPPAPQRQAVTLQFLRGMSKQQARVSLINQRLVIRFLHAEKHIRLPVRRNCAQIIHQIKYIRPFSGKHRLMLQQMVRRPKRWQIVIARFQQRIIQRFLSVHKAVWLSINQLQQLPQGSSVMFPFRHKFFPLKTARIINDTYFSIATR
ncbi:Uncharacterised protein [Cardiobacterium valvarum]|uniref:Uncharacterized protein n=1 Tax=Cardiobacterium valvarum TaxID=194702 RepID=A0A381E5P5_9GAMM|nr:Uncharacterised protein [Cardiobacterium valvarum]